LSGTHDGGVKCAATNLRNYGVDFYKNIGRKGGKISKGGFIKGSQLAREAGAKGGRTIRRLQQP
jgi:general stress protein YciG